MAQKVAYVTGGMGGIGTGICQRLHREGFKVIAGCGPSRDFAKWLDEQKAQGYTGVVFTGNAEMVKPIGLKPRVKLPLFNGPIECRLLVFDLYDGTKRDRRLRRANPAS